MTSTTSNASQSPGNVSGAEGTGRGHVLVVDDEESLRRTFEVFLASAGFRVASAASADGALSLIRQHQFDAVITDIVMPGGDGIFLLDTIRNQDPERPVILMTGNPSVTSATAAVRGGAFDYLAKPVKKDQLLQAVRRAVERYLLIKEKRRLQETNDLQAKMLAEYVRRLESLSTAKDRLTTLLVHDFKNPLSVITSNVEILRQRPELVGLDPDIRASLNDVHDASKGLLQMITMLLDISRMEEAEMTLHLAEMPLGDLVESCLGHFRGAALERRVRLEAQVPREILLAVDRMLLGRVLDNLISNGIRYAPPGQGLILVSAREEGGRAVLTLENNGPAIPADMHARIFDKYGQVDPITDRVTGNRGLGLYFCRLAIEAHQGSISVGDRVGGGVCFRIELPFLKLPD